AEPQTATHQVEPASKRLAKWRTWLLVALLVAAAGLVGGGVWLFSRYEFSEEMLVAVTEFDKFDYPEDPSGRSPHYGQYRGRQLRLVQTGDATFDFLFEPIAGVDHVATVAFKNVDVSLLTPGLPEYAKGDDGLRRIALTDREWNRQQAQFYVGKDNVEVTGGDGFERDNLAVASLAKNCLNAGLWEVLLFTNDGGGKQMYYQGWFTFPMGQYKRLWEANTGLSYWDDVNFYRMEHWLDPAGNLIPLDKLREVVSEKPVEAHFDPDEEICFGGEQVRKRRTTQAPGVRCWRDFVERRDEIKFATFTPPGYYDTGKPWGNDYGRLAEFNGCTLRRVKSKLNGQTLDELELAYTGVDGEQTTIIIGGLDLMAAPQLPRDLYPQGYYLPMGIGVPPFYQDYAALLQNRPHESPYYSFVLDAESRWVDHHSMAIDGPVIHRDPSDPSLVHLYLLSYERHQLVAHYEVQLNSADDVQMASEKPASRQ
ncbi:MAG: hypothetical protein AAF589_06595, partial [Planctomycetota bacterium]